MVVLTRPEGTEPADLHLSRRGVAGLMFAGYALAAVSAEAEPVHTDEQGLITETVRLSDEGLPAYVARPRTRGRHGVVIVVNEVFGIHEYIRDICRRFAKLGYVAIAPAFFFRQDPGNALPAQTDFNEIRRVVGLATNAQVMGDVGTTLQWLEHQPFVAKAHIGVTGFCWGGGVVWMACAAYPQIKAGVAWYGRLVASEGQASPLQPKYPVDLAAQLKAPVLGLYGEADQGIPVAQVEQMKAALAGANKTAEFKIYPGAPHGFHADYRASYRKDAADDAWAQMQAWFKKYGVLS